MTAITVPGFVPFVGQHCETVATGSLLNAGGVALSEPMLFGLGEGLGFIFINLSSLPLPFVGGRVKPFELTRTLCRNLKLECAALETTSRARAWSSLAEPLGRGQPVGLQLDCFHLEYFSRPVHFAGHFVAAYGFDEEQVFVVDTAPQGSKQHVSRRALEAARFAKGPMAAKARSWTIAASRSPPDLAAAIPKAIRANARAYLSPAFQGASYLGIGKLAASLPRWHEQADTPTEDLALAALLMERAGTGGAVFRNFYRDFLHEARAYSPARAVLDEAHAAFTESARRWTCVAALIDDSARTGHSEPLREAADHCRHIADIEVAAMKVLSRI